MGWSRNAVMIIVLLYLATRILPILIIPFVLDESLYAVMSQEQALHPTIIPTFLGYPVSWKPALLFWTYSAASSIPLLPLEASFRYPSFIFGLLTLPLIAGIFRNARVDDDLSFFSMIVFLLSIASIYPDSALLSDAMMFFLVCLSLLFYTQENLGRGRFILAAVPAFLAFFVKMVVAYISPVLAVSYFFFMDRKTFKDPVFLLSLLAVPLAMCMHYALMAQAGLSDEAYLSDIGGHLVKGAGLLGQLSLVLESLNTLIATGLVIWFSLSVVGFARHYRMNPFMSSWYALSLIPLLFSSTLFYYFLPVMPAISYFAVAALLYDKGKEKKDLFFMAVFSILCVASLAVAVYTYSELYADAAPQRDAGYLLSGKENVLILGKYVPGIVAYKLLPEMRAGNPKNFGWVVLSSAVPTSSAMIYVTDYHSMAYPVVEGSFSSFFTRDVVFRKDSDISRFDYVAYAGPDFPQFGDVPLLYNSTKIAVMDFRKR